MTLRIGCVLVGFLSLVLSMSAQTSGSSPASAQVPPLIQFSNVATDEGGNSLSGVVSITFSLYHSQQGGAPLWTETQNNVQLDPTGHYSVQLGVTKPAGVPTPLFTLGEARWLGVRIGGQAEQTRVLLVSVPYALKAGDATTFGGLPPSAFVLAASPDGTASGVTSGSATGQGAPPPSSNVTGTGTVSYLPLWDSTSDIISSVLFQKGTGSTAKIGINTTKPASTLDVKGGGTIRGLLNLPPTGTATAAVGFNSQPTNLAASAFNSGTGTAVTQNFQWQAEPLGNDSGTASGSLNLLFGQGSNKLAETGLNIASNGQITFATGQTFPGTGNGTVTSVGSGAGLTGGPITGSGTLSIAAAGVTNAMLANPSLTVTAGTDLTGGGAVALGGSTTINLDTTKVPLLNTANTFNGSQTVNGNLSATGVVTGSGFQIGGNLFAFGSYANNNAFLGFAGNSTVSGFYNTASGMNALGSNTTGAGNTASGMNALVFNTSGSYNTATGFEALFTPTNGIQNTASGSYSLYFNESGYNNTADGYHALASNTTGYENTAVGVNSADNETTSHGLACVGYDTCGGTQNLHNAGAFGTRATVEVSDAIVLGSVAGVNGATATVRVGIGTTKPTNLLTLGQGAGLSISDGWATYSSRRWKTNIQPLHNALRMVEQLRGVSYDLKDSGKHEIGVIAEEVGAVVPEVVSYEENGKDARGVDYSRLTALLIEAVKQQQRQIKTQQQQIARLNGKVGVLEATLRMVEHAGKLPATVRSSATKTHGLPSERTKYVSPQGN